MRASSLGVERIVVEFLTGLAAFRAWLSQPLSVRTAARTGPIGDLTRCLRNRDKSFQALQGVTCILQKLLGAKRTAVVEAYEGTGSS